MTRHRIFGAGLVGGYIAGVLASSDQDVSAVAREEVINRLERGLTLTDLDGNHAETAGPVFLRPGEAAAGPPPDVLWLTVKCTDVARAVPDLPPHVGPRTVILCCQNGLGSEATLKAAFPGHVVLRGMVPFNVAQPEDNHLHRGSGGALTLEAHPRIRDLPLEIRSPLMPMALSDDIEALLWAKLQLNLVNAVNALSDIPVREMLERRGYRRVFSACMRELLAVTRKREIELPRLTALPPRWLPRLLEQPDWIFARIAKPLLEVDPTVRTSMWWDITRGKPTEVDFLNGEVVAAGERAGVPTPVNARIVELVKAAERSGASPSLTPDELLDAAVMS